MTGPLRIWRSPLSAFGRTHDRPMDLKDETVTAASVYTDEVLDRIAESGFNAIWVHGLLRNIVRSDVFPEFGRNERVHLANMRALIRRAGRHGLGVLLYMQPPRGIDVEWAFWKRHRDVGGPVLPQLTDGGHCRKIRSLCTSTQEVRSFLYSSSRRLAQKLPALGGVILITASEYVSHCYGSYSYVNNAPGPRRTGTPLDCPRCRERHPIDVVSEIIRLVRDGMRDVSRQMRVIVWNWSWTLYEKDPCTSMIRGLPRDVTLMAGFERGGTKRILGKTRLIDEYSLSYAGPSSRFRAARREAARGRLEVMAKLQIGTTHELATVPNLPLIGNLYTKVRALRSIKVLSSMACWNFGSMLSANTAAFNRFMSLRRLPAKRKALTDFASAYFPGCRAELVARAWDQFARAMDSYPFSIPFLYYSPVNYSPAYPIRPRQVGRTTAGRSWMDDARGECLETSIRGYTLREIVTGLGRLTPAWKTGAAFLERGLQGSDSPHACEERSTAWACYHIFRSTWNTYRAYELRRKWKGSKRARYTRIAKNEYANLERFLPLVEADRRLGFHGEARAFLFDAASVKRKLRQLERQIALAGKGRSRRG